MKGGMARLGPLAFWDDTTVWILFGTQRSLSGEIEIRALRLQLA